MRLWRLWKSYRRLRRDQAPNHAMRARMKRHYALEIAWGQSRKPR
jgi:hypothetical protein